MSRHREELEPHARRPPSTKGGKGDGRDARGRFIKGYKGGPGNPYARRVQGYRTALFAAVTMDDVHAVARKLVDLAVKHGDVAAAKVLLERVLGKSGEDVLHFLNGSGGRYYRSKELGHVLRQDRSA